MTTARVNTPAVHLSGPMVTNLAVYRGDSGRFRITVADYNGTPVDISTATWDADIRKTADDPTVITSFTVTPVAGDPASVDVVLAADQSALLDGNCVYDVQMTLGAEVSTLIYGSITLTQDVSRA